ncbi:MAG: YitT family protein [Parafilimonas sp.]
MQVEKLKAFIFEKMHNELPHWLTYHSAHHTEEVINHSLELGQAHSLSPHDLDILHTAAILHDAGFLISNIDHERSSCNLAREYLPQFEYTEQQIEEVCKLIMTTRLPQSAFDKISRILCDADLYYLGTNDYQLYSGRLYRELKHYTPSISNAKWLLLQKEFLEAHEYFTDVAKTKLNSGKKTNLKRIKSNYKQHTRSHHDFKISDILLMLLGSVIAGFSLKGFLIPNNFLDGGLTGISLLIHEVYHFKFPLVIIAVNIPLILAGAFVVNKKFAIKTFISIVCVGLCVYYIPYPVITSDHLLISIFGGFFAGVGMGLSIRAGSAIDGIEVLALYTLKRSSFTISEIIMAINAVIFIIAAFHFTIETSLYSMLTYFTASKTLDYVVEGVEAYTGVTIISINSEHIKERLVNEMGRGITIYKGERGFLPGKYDVHSDVDIIFTVITRLELRRLKNLVYAEDANAFIFANTIKETSGGIIKRRPTH